MQRRTEIDMLHGPLTGKIWRFALPIAASAFLQQLFNAADNAVVGNFAQNSEVALAAVGGNAFVIGLIVNLFLGMSVGANVVIASYRGQKNDEGVSKALHTAVTFAVICGTVLMLAGLGIADLVHEWLGTGAAGSLKRDQAVLYFRIYFLGVPFIMLYNYESAILRSKGDTKRPLIVLAASGVLNVVLNVVLVRFVHLDVAGVAIATVASNVFSSVVLFVILMREDDAFRLRPRQLGIDGRMLGRMVQIGLPAGIQTSMFSIANVILQGQINALDGVEGPITAATTVGLYAEFFAYDFIAGFSQAATTFVGQNYAVANTERCRTITRICFFCGVGLTVCVCALLTLLRVPFVSIFNQDPEIVHFAAERVLMVGSLQFLNGAGEILSGSMRGMKRSLIPALISVIGVCGVRLIWVWTVYPAIGMTHAHLCVAWPLSWGVTAAAMAAAYFFVRRRAELEVSLHAQNA
ncbi:MAG: MATE family efflux transporter [Clostridia bacterium]|nr:MATE family efflux transporter [Clostridia bacterium]